jgi:hypothetical protein
MEGKMNDNQVRAMKGYWELIADARDKTYVLKSFGKIIMFDIPLADAIKFATYYKAVSIEEYKVA